MSGPDKSKILIKANVYIHKKDEATRSKIIHIDVESDELAKIIKPGESTYVGGKPGGFFVGLKKEMIKRAEELVKNRKSKV